MNPPSTPEGRLQATISLTGAVALVVGGVIGAGLFVLIREIAAQSGGAVWLAFTLAIAVSLVGVIPVIQLAGAIPRAGAGYLFASRLLSPFLGIMTSYWAILGGAASTSVVSLTLALYIQQYVLAGWPVRGVALLVLSAFYGMYWLGMRLAMSLQVLMAIQFVTALVIYAVAGTWLQGAAFSLTIPHGAAAFFMAVLLCYSTCLGFQVIAEMGEEIRDARRNIPLALLIGGIIVGGIYILMGAVFVASVRSDPGIEAALQAPLIASARSFLPPWLVEYVGFGALTAGLTSLNAAAIALPRELFAQARDGVLPRGLARIHPRAGGPQNAVTVFFIFVAGLLAIGWNTEFYGYLAAIGILAISSALSVAAVRLPRLQPEYYAGAYIRFAPKLLILCAIITIAVSLGFGLIVIVQSPTVMAVYAAWTVFITGFYFVRIRRLTSAERQQMTRFETLLPPARSRALRACE
jgi:APA family basic amino acid/polyamine antiporter